MTARPRVWVEASLSANAQRLLEGFADLVPSDELASADGAVVSSRVHADDAFIEQAGLRLLVIARTGIGVDNIDIDAATRRGILVINTPDAPTESTAEHTVALMLSLAKRVVRGHSSLTTSPLPREELFGTELRGRVLGVVGYGRIGRRVAEICGKGLGMRVIVYDPYVVGQTGDETVEMAGSLTELLREADVLTLHLSLTQETRKMIGRGELASMKPASYLINASRGPVVDEAALLDVLREGRIAGAALDVFTVEPPEQSNPLFRLPNVVVTPHIASYTEAGVEAMGRGVVEQLEAVFRGERPHHLVNPEAWPGRTAGGRGR